MPNGRRACLGHAISLEWIMKLLTIAVFLVVLSSPSLFAISHGPNGYQKATVLSVNRHITYSPNECCDFNATDAPLESTYYTYDIKARVGCTTYVVERDSEFGHMSTVFGPNGTASVRVTKYYLYFLNSFTDSETRMRIVHHHTNKTGACSIAQGNRSS
jgi:hypothetical protein